MLFGPFKPVSEERDKLHGSIGLKLEILEVVDDGVRAGLVAVRESAQRLRGPFL